MPNIRLCRASTFGRRSIIGTLVVGLCAPALTALPQFAPSAAAASLNQAAPTPVPTQTPNATPPAPDEVAAASHWAIPTVTYPAAGSQTVPVSAAGLASAGVMRVAAPSALGKFGLPTLPATTPRRGQIVAPGATWAANTTAPAPTQVRLTTLDSTARAALGNAPMVFEVARNDGGAAQGPVAVSLDYSGFRDAFGGNFADRLELVRYPACVLTTPSVGDCSTGVPVAGQANDPSSTTLTAVVSADGDQSAVVPTPTVSSTGIGAVLGAAMSRAVSADASPAPSPTDSTSPAPSPSPTASDSTGATPTTDPTSASSTDSVFVVTAAASGSSGSYTASPLNVSSTWSVGLESGTLTYSYPISVPSSLGGAAPRVALDYDSGSVDGRTSVTNPQASQLGMGWDYSPGFIERGYESCDDPAIGGSTPDLCYVPGQQDVTLNLNGRDVHLIATAGTTPTWRIQDDPGWLVTHSATGASNNDDSDHEYWKLQSPDGTVYYFGRGIGRAGTGLTHSVYTAPVYNYESSCPDTGATYCKKGWRWNLDYVVDRNGNATTYYYNQEFNAYKVHGGGSAISYVSGGTVNNITYGYQDKDDSSVNAVDKVVFTTVQRCVQHANGGSTACPTLGPANATSYPDVPTDLICVSGSTTCTQTSPSFFSTVMYSNISTQRYLTTGYSTLDAYDIQQQFPDPDGTGPESPALWLSKVTHTGQYGGSVTLPSLTTGGTKLPNRFDIAAGVSAVDMYRVTTINNETGGQLAVNYGTPDQCTTTLENGDHSHDTLDCFPVHWVPQGSTTWAAGWFNKYLVTRLGLYVPYAGETPQTSPPATQLTAEPMVTDYTYTGGAAWHKNEFQLNSQLSDTWNEYRGYKTVTVTEDRVDDGMISGTTSRSVTTHTFFRGMYGDPYLAGDSPASNTDTVTSADYGAVNDYAWLDGQEAEVVSTAPDGTLLSRTDTSYWWSQTAIAPPVGSDPAEVAVEVQTAATQTDTPQADGVLRHHEVSDAHYAASNPLDIANGAVVTHVDEGDQTGNADANCTNISYTDNQTTGYLILPALKATYDGLAGASGCPGTGLRAETKYYYDGNTSVTAAPSFGNLSCQRVYLTSVTSGDCPATPPASPPNPATYGDTYTSYDIYGRVTSTTDADLNATATAYTPATGRPTEVDVTNAAGQTTRTSLDLRGMPTDVTDANGNHSRMGYDALGRLTAAWAPTETGATATFTASYTTSNSGWSTVETKNLISGTAYRDTWTYLDGWLRTREVHTVPFGTVGGHLTVQTRYNDVGEVASTSSPSWGNSSPGHGMDYTAPNSVPLETRYSYDALHRQTVAARTVNGAQNWGNTTTSYFSDVVTTTPPAPAPITTQHVDIWGKPLSSTETNQAGYPTATSTMTYGYDSLGRLASVADAANITNSYVYDLGGRRSVSTDADAGQTTSTYDGVGNVTKTVDALGAEVDTKYDNLNRPSEISQNVSGTSTPLVDYTYDNPSTGALGLGLLASTTVHDVANGTGNWTTTVNSYDADGRPTSVTYAVPSVAGLPSGGATFQYSTAYQADGQPTSLTFPTVGDVAGESVALSYEVANGLSGLPTALIGSNGLSATDAYSTFNQLTSRTLGATGNGQAVRTYTYSDPLMRLSEMKTTATAGGVVGTVQDDTYSYDNANNPTQISGKAPSESNQQTCYGYDGLDRLVLAYTETSTCGTTTSQDGPAGFNEAYTYNANGTPATLSQSGVPHAYTEGGASEPPHAVTAYNGNTYGYDANGQQTLRTVGGVSTVQTWDPLHHLTESSTGTSVTNYVNAPDGSRIARQDPDGSTTIWLGGDELHVAAGTITDTRYYTFAGSTIAMRNAGGLTWLASDTQNSRQLAINASTGAATRAYYTPYGAVRPNGPVLPTDQNFLGHVLDSTGLVQDGARYYDPSIGQFVSPDPIIDVRGDANGSPYSYGNDSPTALSDPSGLTPRADDLKDQRQVTTNWLQAQAQGAAAQTEDNARRVAATAPGLGILYALSRGASSDVQNVFDLLTYDGTYLYGQGQGDGTVLGAVEWELKNGQPLKTPSIYGHLQKLMEQLNRMRNMMSWRKPALTDYDKMLFREAEDTIYARLKVAGDPHGFLANSRWASDYESFFKDVENGTRGTGRVFRMQTPASDTASGGAPEDDPVMDTGPGADGGGTADAAGDAAVDGGADAGADAGAATIGDALFDDLFILGL